MFSNGSDWLILNRLLILTTKKSYSYSVWVNCIDAFQLKRNRTGISTNSQCVSLDISYQKVTLFPLSKHLHPPGTRNKEWVFSPTWARAKSLYLRYEKCIILILQHHHKIVVTWVLRGILGNWSPHPQSFHSVWFQGCAWDMNPLPADRRLSNRRINQLKADWCGAVCLAYQRDLL